MSNVWDVLIATIPHRHAKLLALLAELDSQHLPGFGVLLYRDNRTLSIGAKRQALLEASRAGWVSFIDDDDMVYPGFVSRVLLALAEGPDCVGFTVEFVVDGEPRGLAEHSIRYPGWHNWPDKMVRDISHLNPVRRDIALLGRFEGSWSEDAQWAASIRDSGRLVTEAWIPGYTYRYQFSSTDNAAGGCRGGADETVRPLPAYPWLTVLETPESV